MGCGRGSRARTRRSRSEGLLLYDAMGGSGNIVLSFSDLWRIGRDSFTILGMFAVALE